MITPWQRPGCAVTGYIPKTPQAPDDDNVMAGPGAGGAGGEKRARVLEFGISCLVVLQFVVQLFRVCSRVQVLCVGV